jgi:starch phosphorylase
VEAGALYDLLEREVIPEFYARDSSGIPTAWVSRMRESMARLTPRFSASRTVAEYTEHYYIPAARAYHERAAGNSATGRHTVQWRRALEQEWALLRFGNVNVETHGTEHLFEIQVYLHDLDPDAVRVELYADAISGGDPVREKMERISPLEDAPGGYVYRASVSAARAPSDYTARIVPHRDGVAVPLEAPHILWQR